MPLVLVNNTLKCPKNSQKLSLYSGLEKIIFCLVSLQYKTMKMYGFYFKTCALIPLYTCIS